MKELVGMMQVEVDKQPLDVHVHKKGSSIYLSWCWPGPQGGPVEHLVHPMNERSGDEPWVRELRAVFKTSVTLKRFTPAHLLGK